MVEGTEIYHYHLDHLGTPKELTNQRGRVVWAARYRSYGSVAALEVNEVENNLRFLGQYFDAESGLHYNRHRYYNPSSGQFISQDPIGLLGGVNNYQYAPNPTGWVDPFGLTEEKEDPLRQSISIVKPQRDHFSVIGANGVTTEQLASDTILLRFEPRNIETPMEPHDSPFFDISKGMEYGLKPDWHKALFVASEDKKDALQSLRKIQGYFDDDVVLRQVSLGQFMQDNPGAYFLSDYKFNATAEGFERGGYILVVGDRNKNSESL